MAALLLATLGGCGRPPELVGVDNPKTPAESVTDATRHRVFIITTRAASEAVGAFYSGLRTPELGLASVTVSIPPNHVVGKVERPSQLPPDPRRQVAVVDPSIYTTRQAFLSQVNSDLATRPRGDRKVLLFIHGYNTSTSDAILRLAQFVQDTGYSGVPVLFTWASAAKAPRYVYDLNSALVARDKVDDIAAILNDTKSESVDIFAHSMGCFLTMEGLVDAAQEGRLASMRRIRHIILAAPDIDIDLFRTQLLRLPESIRKKIYILVSRDDEALQLSRFVAGGVPRVGAADEAELEKLGVTVIDVSEVTDSSLGTHSKFAGSPEVVQLIGEGLSEERGFGLVNSPMLTQLLAGAPIHVFSR